MKIFRLLMAVLMAAFLFVGCQTVDGWLSGKITEGIPRLREGLPRTTKMYFSDPVNVSGYALHARNRKQIQDAFFSALDAVDVSHSTQTNGCDMSIHVAITNWEYGDAGFSGMGDRDSVSMTVLVMDIRTERVVARHELYARDLGVLVNRYVEKLFEKK